MRNAGYWLVGVVCGGITVGLCEALGHLIWPPPEGVDFSDPAAIQAVMAAMPVGAFLALIGAWFAGALVGSGVAFSMSRNMAIGWAAGAMTVLGTVANLVFLPHPMWVTVLGPLAALAGAGLGPSLALKARSQGPDAAR